VNASEIDEQMMIIRKRNEILFVTGESSIATGATEHIEWRGVGGTHGAIAIGTGATEHIEWRGVGGTHGAIGSINEVLV
jgi:hypothetical protein